jgi:hypothetical protein
MTRSQQYSRGAEAIDRYSRQRIDRSDPTVAAFVAEYGLAAAPVAIKLTGDTEADVKLQIDRLEKAFGSLVAFTRIRRDSMGVEWVCNGTLLA